MKDGIQRNLYTDPAFSSLPISFSSSGRSGLIWGEDYDKLSEEDKKAHRDSASVQQQALSQAIEDGYDVFVLNPSNGA